MDNYIPKWANKKTGKLYVIFDVCIDKTSERDGLPVIIYRSVDVGSPLFVREKKEFLQKFEGRPYETM